MISAKDCRRKKKKNEWQRRGGVGREGRMEAVRHEHCIVLHARSRRYGAFAVA